MNSFDWVPVVVSLVAAILSAIETNRRQAAKRAQQQAENQRENDQLKAANTSLSQQLEHQKNTFAERLRLQDIEIAKQRELIKEQETLIKDQRTQTQELAGYRVMYETLAEAHAILKQDHTQLRQEVEETRVTVAKLVSDLDVANRNARSLQAERDELMQENAGLKTAVMVYQDVFNRFGDLLRDVGIVPDKGITGTGIHKAIQIQETDDTEASSQQEEDHP